MTGHMERVYNLDEELCRDCYYIVSESMGDAENFYYSVQYAVNNQKHIMFVNRHNDFVRGFIVGKIWNGTAKIDHLYVSRKYQRMGVGAALLNQYIDYAKSKNADRVVLQSRCTVQALNFYKNNGFAQISGAYMLQKTL